MPGNETIYKSPRAFLPVLWSRNNVPQSADVVLDVASLPAGLNQMPMARAGSITAILVVLSEPVVAGGIAVILRKNGATIAPQLTIGPGDGITLVGELPPGVADYQAGDTVGVHLSATSGLAPNAQIDLAVYLEVQPV